MGDWYLAPSLDNLRDEINSRWPNRDTASDGTIGDADHAASASDHNPNSRGSVNAIDIDKDGVDVNVLMEAYKQHPSTHYFIYNRKIYDKDNGFTPQDYYGSNPHDKHIHLSIRQSESAEQNQTPWGIEEEMDQATFNARMDEWVKSRYTAPDNGDPKAVASRNYMRAWWGTYVGGPFPPGMNSLSVLKEILDISRYLKDVPPGTVTVDDKQLQDAVREVIGSVDEFPVSE